MGIAAIVVGISALLFGWVPYLGLLAIPVAVLGVFLAGMGLLIAMMRKFKGAGLPLLGGVLSLIGVGVPLISTGGTSVVITEAIDEVSKEMKADRQRVEQERMREEKREADLQAAYITDHIELYDVQASYMDSLLNGEVPGVQFKLKNTGDKTLVKVKVTFFFEDESGAIIAEEEFCPVLVNSYSYSSNNDPLKPGYVWQMEKGKFYSAKSVPSEWVEGCAVARVTEVQFSE